MEAKKRKYQSILLLSGTALIVFSMWDILKIIFSFVFSPTQQFIIMALFDFNEQTIIYAIIIFALLALIEFLINLFIALSAKAEARGKKKSVFYLVVLCILLAVFVANFVSSLIIYIPAITDILSAIDAIIMSAVSFASIFALTEILISSIGLRKINKKEQQQCN
ncbi:MAG: hypothetical protein IJ542_01320 [Clostridia bacterium]|nr:hypothetical protein [Clostridia bacterium]